MANVSPLTPPQLEAALSAAMEAGFRQSGTTSPNPSVGAVIVDPEGNICATGATQPPSNGSGAHAETEALKQAGDKARGATAVVTLEPCSHTGKTGPCTEALISAGIAQVYYLHSDPTPEAQGGHHVLQDAGIAVHRIPESVRTDVMTRNNVVDSLVPWLTSINLGRPYVTLKFAQTLDGFTAAADGSSQWITGEEARDFVHEDRARRDAIVVGTGTALADNPSLTARYPDGSLREDQPRRVVVGTRDIKAAGPACSNLIDLGFEQYPNIDEALVALFDSGARNILVEGGSGLASAFLNAGYVDAIQAYIAPVLLGGGQGVLAHPVAQTLSQAPRFRRIRTRGLGEDILIEYAP